jgi:Ca-activated chloride channel homolog
MRRGRVAEHVFGTEGWRIEEDRPDENAPPTRAPADLPLPEAQTSHDSEPPALFSMSKTTTMWVYLRVALFLFAATSIPALTNGQDVHIVPRAKPGVGATNTVDSTSTLSDSSFRVNVDLVLVPVTVTDSLGRLVTGLNKEHFQLYEDKKLQVIGHFSSEDVPVSVGIILDVSGSMTSKIERAREAVMQFVKAANPQDEFFMITFAEHPELVTDFTKSVENIQSGLLYSAPKGRTALLDAIYLGISLMRRAQYAKKALLIISDGGDNHSRYTEREIKRVVREADTLVYAIGIYDYYFATIEEQLGPALLSDVSEATGGRMFTVDNFNDLAGIAARIGVELRNQYVLGYRPKKAEYAGKWRKIKVRLAPPKGLSQLQVRAKQGYYAASH